jgi:large subunit ribosomal protein L37Ae
MAEENKMYGSVKRFGVRYGTKLKGKIAKIEAERHASTKCPYCHYNMAKRLSAGIWECGKCKSKFTGKAYSITAPVSETEKIEAEKAPVEETETPEEEEDYDEQEQEGVQEETAEPEE